MKYKDLQYNSISGWRNMNDCQYPNPDMEIRIKPEPTLRPWKPEEVPVGAVVKSGNNRWLITAVWNGKLFMNGCDLHDDERSPSLQTLTMGYEHSLDHGITWQPCGILE